VVESLPVSGQQVDSCPAHGLCTQIVLSIESQRGEVDLVSQRLQPIDEIECGTLPCARLP
jgi:hypothetical protein